MKSRSLMSLLIAVVFCSFSTHSQNEKPQVERLDSALDSIISASTAVQQLADTPGQGTREGPVWVRKGGYLLYSDLPNKAINKWDPRDGTVSVFIRDTDSDGVTLDPQGRLVWAADSGQVVRLEKNGKRTVLAKEYAGKLLNAPNDLVYKRDGALYFTDPGHFQMNKEMTVNLSKDIPAVYLLKNGKLALLTNEVVRANGIAFAPEEKFLYINSSFKMQVMRFEVKLDDTIANPQLFIDMNADKQHPYPSSGFPDGMKVDSKGNVYCTGPKGVWIISPEGKHLGTIVGVNRPANLTFGEADGKTLFITSRPGLYRVRVEIPGIRP